MVKPSDYFGRLLFDAMMKELVQNEFVEVCYEKNEDEWGRTTRAKYRAKTPKINVKYPPVCLAADGLQFESM